MRSLQLLPVSALVLACAFSVVSSPRAAHAQNLLVNGSFEQGNFTGANPQSAPGATQLPVGSTNMTGWTTVNGELAWLQIPNNYNAIPSEGTRFLDLSGYHDSAPYGGVTQNLATSVGALYQFTFDLGAFAGLTNSVTASAGAVSQIFSFTALAGGPGYQYGTQSFQFTAAGTTTAITLTGTSSGRGDEIGLDNVSVVLLRAAPTGAPEPGSLALLLPVLGTVGMVLRKPRRRN